MRAGHSKVYAPTLPAPVGRRPTFGSSSIYGRRDTRWASLPISPRKPLRFRPGSRSSQFLGCIIARSLLSSSLVVVGKRLELTRNRLVSHGLGGAEQSLRRF